MVKLAIHCSVLMLFFAAAMPAQNISLNDSQRQRLIKLVDSDSEAKDLFAKLKHYADQYLKDDPNPISKIETGGKLAGDPAKTRTSHALHDITKISTLGWAWSVTSEKSYSDKAVEFILDWAKENKPTGQPIDENNLDDLIITYNLLQKEVSDADRKTIESWLHRVADAEMKSGTNGYNNWNSHRLKIVGLIGWGLRDKKLIDWTIDHYKEQISKNLKSDGASIDFHDRDALHYHTYDIEPLLMVAIAAQLNGVDLYHHRADSGACLARAVDFLVPYANGDKTHAEFVHTKVKFDHQRADNGQSEYTPGHPWEPSGSRRVFELETFFAKDSSIRMLHKIGRKFDKYDSWDAVILDVQRG